MAPLSSRSRFRRQSPSKLPPWAIVAICLAAAIILTVILLVLTQIVTRVLRRLEVEA